MSSNTGPSLSMIFGRSSRKRHRDRASRHGDLLETMAKQRGYSWDSAGLVIIEGAIDPNVSRHALTERVAYGTVDLNLTNDGELVTIRPAECRQPGRERQQ